jgi:putative aminopeptidase FrvX
MSDERSVAADVVATLCDLPGPSGHEQLVAEHLFGHWSELGAVPRLDAVGNVLARVGGSGPRVLIQAHMDEIGFVVRHVTDDGFLFLDSTQDGRRQSHERRYMVGQPAGIMDRSGALVPGVFAAPSGHVLTQRQLDRPALTYSDFFVDVGADSAREVAEWGIHVGAPVIWDVRTRRLGSRLIGKAMDDRMMLAVITLLLQRLGGVVPGVDLWVAGTVQEENLFHGARALAARERFDAVIVLDLGLAGDIPGVELGETNTSLKGGPVIVHQDKWIVYDRRLSWELIDAAGAAGVPVQQAVYANYGTDGVAFIDSGSPAALVGAPVRYTHTAIESVDLADVLHTVDLLHAFLERRRVA